MTTASKQHHQNNGAKTSCFGVIQPPVGVIRPPVGVIQPPVGVIQPPVGVIQPPQYFCSYFLMRLLRMRLSSLGWKPRLNIHLYLHNVNCDRRQLARKEFRPKEKH
ncbi:hypothetical protein BgiMline_003474 [Biomphalaria glabrata]|nr:hypothetical protein BgiMline_012022 [Biomphalaria glabrata]